ncbi:hypothetical protein [Chromohalobacter sp. 296-RDG]|uniref:hypothetical protein n=1 Tax=Chromohalobacter sp. 296-RDG TaxID=2994062 RepID=UPI00246992D4|nr:hypothetical protein [Chromohalobacter sp. 296-RDG]
MMYLKFVGHDGDVTIDQRCISTRSYSLARDNAGIRVYDDHGMWERVSPIDWRNCFVMNETGNTIDKIEAE